MARETGISVERHMGAAQTGGGRTGIVQIWIVRAATAGMELSWLFVLLTTLNATVAYIVSIPLLFVAFFLAWAVAGLLKLAGLSRVTAIAVTWFLWLVVMLLMVKLQLFPDAGLGDTIWLTAVPRSISGILSGFQPALLIFLGSGVLWWLGARLALSALDFPGAVAEFQFGFMILTIVFLLSYVVHLDQSGLIPAALCFVTSALIAMAATRSNSENDPLSSLYRGPWWAMLLAGIGAILVLGLLAGIIFTPELMHFIARGLGWAWGTFQRLLEAIGSLFSAGAPEQPAPPAPTTTTTMVRETFVFELPKWLDRPARVIYASLVAGAVLLALWRVSAQVFGWLGRKTDASEVQMESLKGAFRKDLAGWLRGILSRLRRMAARGREHPGHDTLSREAASIRHLYAQMLGWCAHHGYPRPAAQTANEFERVLREAMPDAHKELAAITDCYVRTRYGGCEPSEPELLALRHTLRALRHTALVSTGTPVADIKKGTWRD